MLHDSILIRVFPRAYMQISSLFKALQTCNLMFISSTNYIVFKHVFVKFMHISCLVHCFLRAEQYFDVELVSVRIGVPPPNIYVVLLHYLLSKFV